MCIYIQRPKVCFWLKYYQKISNLCVLTHSINSDDPGSFNIDTTAFDFLICVVFWEWTLEEVKECLYESIDCSLFQPEKKKQILADFEARWKSFNL